MIKQLPQKTSRSQGFTIVELLIVVMLISVLGAIIMSLINSSGIRGKANDAQRKADLGKLAAALEVYYSDHRSYPVTSGDAWELIEPNAGALFTELANSNGYIASIPVDPKFTTGPTDPCADPTNYRYNYRSDGSWYYLTAILEAPDVSHASVDCANMNNWSTNGCSTYETDGVCYGLTNP